MKKLTLSTLFALLSLAALPGHAQYSSYVTVPVVNTTPLYATSYSQRQVCNNTVVERQVVTRDWERDRGGNAAAGAFMGGVAGNMLGHGGNRAGATIIGATVGAALAESRERPHTRIEERPEVVTSCQYVSTPQTYLQGYQVTYLYQGQQYTTTMAQNPGMYVQINVPVAVMPAGQPYPTDPYGAQPLYVPGQQ